MTKAEKHLVAQINQTWTRAQALDQLTEHLQIAIEIEVATIPIYLFTYYSIDRTLVPEFPSSEVSRFADKAGAIIMSVAVEEMLHMSLSSNMLFALGKQPQLYGRSPAQYPTDLPGYAKLGPDHKPLKLPLAKFSLEHLWHFLEIEYPAQADAPPEGSSWETIGQIYSYIRCIISSAHITDADFKVGRVDQQIHPTNYSPNNIDTAYPESRFDKVCPVPAAMPGSAAQVARFTNRGDSHLGRHPLITVHGREEALEAIATISFQGEGFDHSAVDDSSKQELSHYYKFLTLQSELYGYPEPNKPLAHLPAPPEPARRQYRPEELRSVVFDFPANPVAAAYPPGFREVADLCSGLYQYMLLMTESIFRQPAEGQKVYFNRALHRSMIWILDKFIQSMRTIHLDAASASPGKVQRLAPTFENIDLGPRDQAFGTLKTMCANLDARYGKESWYSGDLKFYVDQIPSLPDVSEYWTAQPPQPSQVSKYAGAPKFPASPPASVSVGEVRHACMGLNSCANQGRTRDNACAGQGYCSTALAYNFAASSQPQVSDHTCHVLNACRGQGGCGLYGTADEQNLPGHNGCASLGSCATPINAERFSTDGPNRGKSVWLRAREVFAEKVWPSLREKPDLPATLPPVCPQHPELFAYGPTIEWIQDYSGQGMTACGASGLSGAGSCT